jgi:2-polyprenyl-6-methoxyphenol hydroxylase-like FAD-dependent oxidoreductase
MEQSTVLPDTDKAVDFDLVIIGYGMVGAVAALLAAQYKLKIALIEIRKTDDLYVPKAGRIDADVMRIFEQLGFDRKDDNFQALKGARIMNSKGKQLLEFEYPELDGFAPMYSIYQPDLQLKLHTKIQEQKENFSIFERHRAEAIELQKDRVKIIANDLEKDLFFEINTRFLIACNGQESLVPAQCDFNYRFLDYTNYSLNIETKSSEALSSDKFAITYVDGSFPLTAIYDSDYHQRWEFRLDPDTMAAPDIYERIRKALENKIPCEFEILNSYLYKYETRILEKWQRKRIFITGDAAHVFPPYLGLGLSAGIKDVYNLIWKIALVADKRVKGQILETYQPEREEQINFLLKVNQAVQKIAPAASKGFFARFFAALSMGFFEKKIKLQSKYTKGFIGTNHKLAGTIFPHFNYHNNMARPDSEATVLSTAFVLLAFNADPVDAVSAQNIEYLANMSVRFLRINSKQEGYNKRYASCFTDADGRFAAWCKKQRIKYLILRPDRLVFDAFKTEKELNKAVNSMSGIIKVKKMGKGA